MSGILALLVIVTLCRKHNGSDTNAAPALISAPLRWAILLLIVASLVALTTMPEAFFVLPAFDAVGLDVATILFVLEMQRYFEVTIPAIKLLCRGALHLSLNLAVREPTVMRNAFTTCVVGTYLLVIAGTALHHFGILPHR